MAVLLIFLTIIASMCHCKAIEIECKNGGKASEDNRFCYCLPGTDGDNCDETVTEWTTGKYASQSTTHSRQYAGLFAVDGKFGEKERFCSLTQVEHAPWWRVHLGALLKVSDVQVVPKIMTSNGYTNAKMTLKVQVGVTSTGTYKICGDADERTNCKGALGYLVVIAKETSTSELSYLGLCEVVVHGTRASVSPCQSNPCDNGGTCKPKDTWFYKCVCPTAWPGRNCEGKNWALRRPVTYSWTPSKEGSASVTVDGDRFDLMKFDDTLNCVTTSHLILSPWWKVELGTTIEVTHVYMVNRVESSSTDLRFCDVHVWTRNGTSTKCYDTSRNTYTSDGTEVLAWFCIRCNPPAVGDTVEIKTTTLSTFYKGSFYAIISLCEVEVYGYLPPCVSNPCTNGGTCREIEQTVGHRVYQCSCSVDWAGLQCESVSPCRSNPCENGGACKADATDNGRAYECPCDAGWVGSNCELPDMCYGNPCANGGTCKLTSNDTSYACDCPASWSGTHCNYMAASTKLLIGVGATVGVAAVGTGAYVCCSAAKLQGVPPTKVVRLGKKQGKEEEEYSFWESLCDSVTSFVYDDNEQEIDADNVSATLPPDDA